MNASAVSIAFDPLLGWPVLAVLGGIGLALVLLRPARRARGTIWRLLGRCVVLAALANPSLVEEQRKPTRRGGRRRRQPSMRSATAPAGAGGARRR